MKKFTRLCLVLALSASVVFGGGITTQAAYENAYGGFEAFDEDIPTRRPNEDHD